MRTLCRGPGLLASKWKKGEVAGDLAEGDNKSVAKSTLSVLGPYRDRDHFRLVLIEGDRRSSLSFSSREEAEQSKRLTLARLSSSSLRTCRQVLEEFCVACRERGLLPATIRDMERILSGFLPMEAPLSSISAHDAAELYRAQSQRLTHRGTPIAAETHHHALRRAKALFRWAVERRYLDRNPFASVKPLGRSNVGKPQLRIDEARRFEATALKMAQDGDSGALAVLLLLRLGMRRSEVMARVARDIDDDGRILWIPRGKTKNARRRLEIPEELQPLVRRLIKDLAPAALIFGSNRTGGVRAGNYLWFKVREVCRRAQVPAVCPHSLRGLHATLAIAGGATHTAVAAALGHSSFAVTARHYADADTLDNTTARKVAETLNDPIERALVGLNAEQRQALLRRLIDTNQ